MKVLVIGSGGREHALCQSLKKSKECENLYCVPGSDAISLIAECHFMDPNNKQEVLNFCKEKNISFVVIGPEIPLTEGLADILISNNIKCFGPLQKGAMLEKSKIFTKELCDKNNVPTGQYKKFSNYKDALTYCQSITFPSVIKANGLAAGKGVIIAQNLEEAKAAISQCMIAEVFGRAGKEIIIEEFLEGEEISLFSLVDSTGYILPLTTAQDHKKIGESETGLNTGGMGAYSPVPSISEEKMKNLSNLFVDPIIKALKKTGVNYQGMFYAGIILTKDGPKLLEINVRFGDPETQAIIPRIKTDLLKLLYASASQNLKEIENIEWDPRYCMTVVMSTKGYPEEFKKNTLIENLNQINLSNDNYIYHAGTKRKNDKWLSNAGRVLAISSLGESIKKKKKNVYSVLNEIKWQDGYYRKDIGWRYK